MQKFNKFYFEKYSFDKTSLVASFFYNFDMEEFFEEKIDFSCEGFICRDDLDDKVLDNLLFNLHLVLGISYYKLFPTKKLVVKSGFISDDMILFWKKLYLNGLGEFFVKNNIDPSLLINFEVYNGKIKSNRIKATISKNNNGSLLMWGGGKDSIVSSIILKNENKIFTPYVFGKIDKIKSETLKVLGKKNILVKRKISENLFKFNSLGYYNGHVPITGIIAFVSILSAYLYNYKNIILSNEKSACEANTIYKGVNINHQYSKGGEFEKDFKNYVGKYLSKDINYFSLLGDKYEYEIASIFASSANNYFYSFSSCNKNFKIINKGLLCTSKWCQKCEKCCFVYIILSPFLDEKILISIFGSNLYEDKSLLNTFKSIIGIQNYKPFECVGTYEESLFSIIKTINIYKSKINSGEIKKIPYILEEINLLIDSKKKLIDLDLLEVKLIGKKLNNA